MKLKQTKALCAAAFGLAALSASVSALSAIEPNPAAKVSAIIARTKTVDKTYAIYTWYRISRPGQSPVEEWAAEFNSGALHRVETPRDRVIANCQTKTGIALSLVTGQETSGAEVAATACGINTNRQFTSEAWVGSVYTPLGKADRVRLTDDTMVRTYDVDRDGVILGSTFSLNSPGEPKILETRHAYLLPSLPDTRMFDAASLKRSYVPELYKTAPQ